MPSGVNNLRKLGVAPILEKYVEPVLKENSGNLVKAMFDYSRASAQTY